LRCDLKKGIENYENGNLKIDNRIGAEFYKSKKSSFSIFNKINSLDEALKNEEVMKLLTYNNYFKDIFIYDENGKLISNDEIDSKFWVVSRKNEIGDEKEWLKKASQNDINFNISLPTKTRIECNSFGPLTINGYCIEIVEEVFNDYIDQSISKRYNLYQYNGIYNNQNYTNGIKINFK
jgi:hypothetical protein